MEKTGLDDTWDGVNLIGDGGYRGAATVTSPVRGKDGRIIRDDTYTEFARKRATAEHVIARWKDWQIMRQNRKRGPNIDDTIRATAALYNMSPAIQTS